MSDARASFDLAADEPTNVRILVALATISTRQDAIIRSNDEGKATAAAQHKELMQRIDTFVPRSEIEKENNAIHKRVDDLELRIERVDGKIWKGVVWVLGTVGTALAGLIGLHVKSGAG